MSTDLVLARERNHLSGRLLVHERLSFRSNCNDYKTFYHRRQYWGSEGFRPPAFAVGSRGVWWGYP